MIVGKMHELMGEKVLAACDKDLLEKEFSQGDLSVKLGKNFYGEDVISKEELIALLKECTTANLFGEETIAVARELYEITNVITIAGIPHAQIFKIKDV